jgi:hypothetical protein
MNLYNYHNKPEQLIGYHKRMVLVAAAAYDYLINTPNGVDKAIALRTISKSTRYALEYAIHTGSRFIEGEPVIAKEQSTVRDYIEHVLMPLYRNGKIESARFILGEPTILKVPLTTYQYARDVLKQRWPEGEAMLLSKLDIKQTSAVMLWYIEDVVKGPWPEAERVMSKDIEWMAQYHKLLSIL